MPTWAIITIVILVIVVVLLIWLLIALSPAIGLAGQVGKHFGNMIKK